MSKAEEEKTVELMHKAKDFIPDGGYSEEELNLAFFMFIKGYHQAEKDLELTWEDMETIQEMANKYCKNHSCEPRFFVYSEILKRFKERKEK